MASPPVVTQGAPPALAPPARARRVLGPGRRSFGPIQDVATTRAGEIPLIVSLVAVGLFVHAANLFNAPAILEDEGTYASQAWAVLHLHRLTPYSFTYDHAPGGWILAAFWMLLTGGPKTFGGAIPSARVLMLLLHVATIPLLYRLARKLGCGPAGAGFATLLYTLSPLALAYQRAFLLDNVMVFWLLISLTLLLDGWGRLSRMVLSGIAFGLAVLAKETAVFLFPALAYIAWRQRWRHHGRFALGAWAVPAGMTVSLYALYALLKGELLPASSALGVSVFARSSRTTLVDAVRFQVGRQSGDPFSLHNAFWHLVGGTWMKIDPFLFGVGAVCVGVNLLRGFGNRRALAAGLLGLFPLLYLMHGGVVFDFYILFALPFLALNIGVAASAGRGHVSAPVAVLGLAAATTLLVGAWWGTGRLQPYLRGNPVQANREALSWVKHNVPPSSRMVVADDFWTDLRQKGLDGPAFPEAQSHWKVAQDPAVRGGVFHNDWRRVDYLLMTPLTLGEFHATHDQVALQALQHAQLVRSWKAGTNVVQLYRVKGAIGSEQDPQMEAANTLEQGFDEGGAYAAADGSVTSEAQAYALLRSVWSNDPKGFDEVWTWTQAHLLRPDGLPSWLYKNGTVADPSTASDADTDIAYALLTAGKRWDRPALEAAGMHLVQAIWNTEVVTVQGHPYLVAGDWGAKDAVLPLNPSYFSPFAYRVFGVADPGHDWFGLLNAGYQLIDGAARSPLGGASSAGLPPDWIGMERTSGGLQPLSLPGKNTTQYSFDAARTFWRVALDYRWTHDGRDAAFLKRAQFLAQEVGRKGTVSAAYAHDGTVVQQSPSSVSVAGALAALMTIDPPKADALYWGSIVGAATPGPHGTTTWGDPTDLYTQEWVWFASAFYNNTLPDLWVTK